TSCSHRSRLSPTAASCSPTTTTSPCRSRPPTRSACPGARALRAHGRRGRAERARLSAAARRTPVRRSTPLVLAGGLLVLALACMLSLMVGARTVPPSTVVEALSDYDASLTDHVVVHSRLLRTLAGIAVGAALAVAGAAMQGMTRNPLADPGILGINAGATAAVVLGVHLVDASRVVEL